MLPSRFGHACALMFIIALLGSAKSAFTEDLESQVKAGFIFNFTKFVEWPEKAFESSNAPLVICILGDDPFGKGFDEALQGQTSAGRKLMVKRVKSGDEIPRCQLLFIGRSERQRLPQLLEKASAANILTVGDFDGFARGGGVIQLITVDGKVRFIVNLYAEKSAGLRISAKLKSLAYEIVRDKSE
jgi:hypothetical protein